MRIGIAPCGVALLLALGLGALGFGAPGLGAARAAPYTPPPLEAYTHLPALENVAISPKGDRIAYLGLIKDQRALIVLDLGATPGSPPLAAAVLGDVAVRDLRWSDETHVLITTAIYSDMNGILSEKSDALSAMAYNTVSKRFVTLLNSGNEIPVGDTIGADAPVIDGPPFVHRVGGKTVLYAVSYDYTYEKTIFEVDPDTGRGVRRDDAGPVQNEDGRAPVREEGVWNYTNGSYSWRLMARDGVAWRELWRVNGNRIESPQLVGRGRGHDTVFVRTPDGGSNTLYEVSLATGARKKLTFEGDPVSVSPMYDPLTDELVGFSTSGADAAGKVSFLDPDRQAAWQSVFATLGDKLISLADHSDDYSRLVIFTSGDTDPGTYWLADLATRKVSSIGRQYPDLTGADVATKRLITYKAADGFEVYAYLTLPPGHGNGGRDPKNLPLIVMPHGGPQERDTSDFDWLSQVIASRGYAVLQPQFRGSDGFGRDYFMAGQGEWGRKMQTDLSDGVRDLAAKGTIDPKRVCIFGWSYGGYAALAGATLEPKTQEGQGVYRCAAAGAPVTDLRRMLAWVKGEGGARDSPVMRYMKRYMGVDSITDRRLDALSPALLAERVEIPVLLIHSKGDSNVPFAQSQEMADALKRAGKPYDFVILDKEDHHLSKDSTRRQTFEALIPFLEKYNPPYP